MTYRTVEVNKGLSRVLEDDTVIGHVRLGLDQKWYPMLPHEVTRAGAVQRVLLAHAALQELRASLEAPGGEAS